MKSTWSVVFSLGEGWTDILNKAIVGLLRHGVIVQKDGAPDFEFSHRMIRDAWLEKRPRTARAQQLNLGFF